MFIRCVYLKRKLVHTLDLRFEVGEPRFVQELALQSAWSCMLACLSFFWPFAILEAVSLVNIVNELGGGNVDWVRYVWPRALQVGACSLQVIVASALTAVSFLAGSSRCFQVFKRLPLELLWAAIAILAFVLLWTSRPDPELSPTKQSWSMLLISLVIFCLPLRFHISWFVFLVAIIMLPFDSTIASPDSYLLGFTILCACRLSWINERVLRRLFEIDPPLPCFVPTINSADGWIGSSSPAKQAREEMGMSMGSLGRGVKERNNRGSKGSQTCQGYDVEKMLSRDSGGVEDTFPVRNIDRSDKHRCMILPLREDFTIREVSEDVRLQIGYDIQGKHLATILNPHSFDDIDFQSEAMYQVSDVVVCFASGPSPAKLCMLRTDLPDPAFFAMITPFSEALNAVQVPSHSSPSVLGDLSHGNQSMMRIASIKSQPGKTPSRRASDSRLISESLIYSKDSHTDGHSADGFWPKELRDVNIQTEASTADSECQTDPIYSGIGALCRRCQRPPTIPMKRQGSGMYSSGGDPVDFLDTSEASEDFAALSPAEVLIQRIQGFWVLHQGPKNTAPWLQSFLVRGSEAESQEDTLEIRTESERVYMAGGVLSLDEDGLLHRYGQSGTHLVYTRQDVQTELNISEPNGLGSKVEAEADETDIENCGDILQAAKEGHVGACRRLLQVDPQSLEQVDEYGDGPLHFAARKGRLEVVQVLLAAGASVEAKNDATGKGPLAWAATGGHPEVVQALLAAGASVEAKNSFGLTPLHYAAKSGHTAVMERLLAAGAAVDAADNKGKTPLHYAAKSGHTAVMERLLAAGAAVDAADNEGWLPLHSVAFNGHTAVVEQLLAAGAAVDAVDSKGKTPLHRATDRGHSAVVEQLLAAGAAVDAVDSKGKTPYDIAKDNDHRKVMGVLDPVFVALISGRSCRCNSAHETVQDLKEEAERKLETTIEHLSGLDMQPLNGAMTLQEANILPGNTLTAVLDPVVLKDFGHGISMKTAQSVFDEYGPRMDVVADWKDLKDPSSLEEVLPPGHVALSQLVRLSPEDITFPKPVEVEMPTCVGAESVWRSSATGWEPLLGAKFSDGRVVVALSHFCDLVVTGPCGLKAVGFIDPHGANAKVALLHVACESCQNSLEQLCSDADMLRSFKKCGPSVPLGTYRHDEDLELRQGQEAMNMRVRFHRMPQISRTLVAHSASHFSVEIEGDDHQFEELRSEAATNATASNPTASDLQSAPATSQAMPAAAMTSDVSMAQVRPERGHLLLSGRFNSDTVIDYMKAVKRRLEERRIPVYMVQAQVGQSFAELTRIGLGRAKGMVAFCTSEYGAYTGAGYETFHELEYAHDNNLYIFPIRLCEQWPPAPQNNERGTFQNRLVFKNGLVFVDDRQMNNAEGAADQIADSVTSSGIFAN